MRDQLTSLNDEIKTRPTTAEVQSEIGIALKGTSDNSTAIAPLSMSADARYQQGQLQQVIDTIDELINALRR